MSFSIFNIAKQYQLCFSLLLLFTCIRQHQLPHQKGTDLKRAASRAQS